MSVLAEKPKPKHKHASANFALLFAPYLRADERLLWVGRPDATRLVSNWLDLIPTIIGLLALLLFVPIVILFLVISDKPFLPTSVSLLIGLLIPLQLLFGRYIFKYFRRRSTFYAVTDERVLILRKMLKDNLYTLHICSLPTLKLSRGFGNLGTITFAHALSILDKRRTNAEWYGAGESVPGFYAIHNAIEVYNLIDDLRGEIDALAVDELLLAPAKRKRAL